MTREELIRILESTRINYNVLIAENYDTPDEMHIPIEDVQISAANGILIIPEEEP